jgi:hypothetical protein
MVVLCLMVLRYDRERKGGEVPLLSKPKKGEIFTKFPRSRASSFSFVG